MLILYVCIPRAPYVLKTEHETDASVVAALRAVPTHLNKDDVRIYSWVIEVRNSAGVIQPQFNTPLDK
jgi:predicted DNA-binding transcriptional regulator